MGVTWNFFETFFKHYSMTDDGVNFKYVAAGSSVYVIVLRDGPRRIPSSRWIIVITIIVSAHAHASPPLPIVWYALATICESCMQNVHRKHQLTRRIPYATMTFFFRPSSLQRMEPMTNDSLICSYNILSVSIMVQSKRIDIKIKKSGQHVFRAQRNR